MTTNTRIRKIYVRRELDPDFGNLQPKIAEAYTIAVTTRLDPARYQFVTLLPEMETEEEAHSLLQEVMDAFLDDGDKYTVRDFDQTEAESYICKGSYAPIISFDPQSLEDEKISFLWLIPPRHLMQ